MTRAAAAAPVSMKRAVGQVRCGDWGTGAVGVASGAHVSRPFGIGDVAEWEGSFRPIRSPIASNVMSSSAPLTVLAVLPVRWQTTVWRNTREQSASNRA
jgi:hypothetical protein